MPNRPESPETSITKSISLVSRNIFDYGPDLVFGWVLLFVLLSTIDECGFDSSEDDIGTEHRFLSAYHIWN